MKEKRYYIAYGSNLSEWQMRFRTPDAKIVGTAVLKDWRLLFKTHATIEPCEGKETPVLVWEISEKDEANLDRYEGYPSYYYKKNLELEVLPIGEVVPVTLTAMVYIMTEGIQLSAPYPGYYRTLEAGYRRFNFPIEILEQALADSIDKDGDESCEVCD
ncbi:MAG: gamma-glutamylcyclotransferase [Lachnospiraceae bacterium]|nr:gamma-glutamylcyclotransferase [Lachnospiraceae bacterium]